MKYLLILGLVGVLSSCTFEECPNYIKRFKYNDKVLILSGFYKGQIGYIKTDTSWTKVCNKPSYYIRINEGRIEEFDDNLEKL